MPNQRFESSVGSGTDRVDPRVQREVIALAARLQEADAEVLSVDELQRMAAEAGVQAKYVQQALRQLTPPKHPEVIRSKSEKVETVGITWPSPWLLLGVAIVVPSLYRHWTPLGNDIVSFALVAALATSSRNRILGALIGSLVFGLAAVGHTSFQYEASSRSYLYIITGMLWGMAMGSFSGFLSSKLVAPKGDTSDRAAKLEQLAQLKQELESQKVHRAFLSVDVVGSRDLRERIGELDAEGLFVRYHKWLETTASAYGGKIQVAAGDGAMAIFPDGECALRASRVLLTEVGGLSPQLRLRLGVSQGLVPEGPIGYIHSSVPDRAATLQRVAPTNGIAVDQECLAEAASIFGAIRALPSSPGVFTSQI